MVDIDRMLQEHGYRSTAPRRAVWQALTDADQHLTVEQLAERIHAATETSGEAGVNVASIYRSLALFRDLDLVRESRLGDEGSSWELAHPDEHFHMVCDSCGAVDHHVGALVTEIAQHLQSGHGFATRSVELVVHGRCAKCTGAAPASTATHAHPHPHSHSQHSH